MRNICINCKYLSSDYKTFMRCGNLNRMLATDAEDPAFNYILKGDTADMKCFEAVGLKYKDGIKMTNNE